MKSRNTLFVLTITFLLTLPANFVAGTPLDETPAQRKPEATIDLATKAGAQLVRGEWRYSDTKIVEVAFKAAGADGQPTGAPNNTYDVKPGQKIQLAVFGINGPISNPPTNYIYMRYAKLEFHKVTGGPIAVTPQEVNVEVVRLDPAIDAIVPANPKIFKLAEGFQFTEGPIWMKNGDFLFSDPNANMIYKYSAGGKLSVFKKNSGYSGKDVAEYFQPGSNGLTLDPQGRLTINEHGNHRVTRVEKDGRLTVLADRFEGKRLNSPNDLVYRSDGTLFFTDPPSRFPKFC